MLLNALRTCLACLKRLGLPRPASDRLDDLTPAALKDIGLSRADLPAVRSGLFPCDPTRRQR